MGIRAHVKSGRFVIEERTSLPEGLKLVLVVDDGGDELSPAERRALHRALGKRWASAQLGNTAPATAVLRKLKSRRR